MTCGVLGRSFGPLGMCFVATWSVLWPLGVSIDALKWLNIVCFLFGFHGFELANVSLEILEDPEAVLEGSRGFFGTILAALGGFLGTPWEFLKDTWGVVGRHWALLGAPWELLVDAWVVLGTPWKVTGGVLGCP